MAYNPSDHKAINQPFGMGAIPLNSKSLFYDTNLLKYRYFQSTAEVNTYFADLTFRDPTFDVIVNTGGTLNAGVITGGTNDAYWYRDGVNLELKTNSVDLSGYYTAIQINDFLDVINQSISFHVNNLDNPHEVTKTQIGLGSVDNTSDANKPVSTPQQTALNSKADTTYVNTKVSDEAALRSDADASLSADIVTEQQSRNAADVVIQQSIVDLSNSIVSDIIITYDQLAVDHKTYVNTSLAGKSYSLYQDGIGRYLTTSEYTVTPSGGFVLGTALVSGDQVRLQGSNIVRDISIIDYRIQLSVSGNIDKLRGPYATIAAANLAIPNTNDINGKPLRLGKFVEIGATNPYKTYWWNGNDFADDKLVEYTGDLRKTDIVNNLTTGGALQVLSAEQGKVLGDKIFSRNVTEGNTLNLETYTTVNTSSFRSNPNILTEGELIGISFNCPRAGVLGFRILSKNQDGTYKLEYSFSYTAILGINTLVSGINFPSNIFVAKDYVIGWYSTTAQGAVGYKAGVTGSLFSAEDVSGNAIVLGTNSTIVFGINYTIQTGIITKEINQLYEELEVIEPKADLGVSGNEKVEDITELVYSTNLVDKSLIILDEYFQNSNGAIIAGIGRGHTAKIPVTPLTQYTVNGGKASYCVAVYWKADGTYLTFASTGGGVLATFTTPANAYYCGLNFADSGAAAYVDTLQLNLGAVALPYEEYYIKRMVKESAIPEGGGGGEDYDQSLNTFDSVEFASARVGGMILDLPTSSSGLTTGQAWVDTDNGNVIKVVV